MTLSANHAAKDRKVAHLVLASTAAVALMTAGLLVGPLQATPATTGQNLSKVVQVALTTHDLPRAIAFYRDTLGLTLMFETNGMAFFRAGDLRLMVGLSRTQQPAVGGSVVYFDAGDWHATEAALLRRGLRFTHATEILQRESDREHALREFTDPDGNTLAIMGWRPQS